MKTSQKQSGSAHVIIITVLVAVIVGLLGFVFWQNFINKKDNSQAASIQQTTAPKTSETKVADETVTSIVKLLTVPDFGVTINKPNSDDSYHVISQDSFAVWISNAKLDSYLNNGTDCEVKGVQLSKIPSADATDNARTYSSDINGYKYGVAKGLPNFATCNDNQNLISTFSSVRDALIAELPSLK